MICIDTMVLIWGVQGTARSGQEGMIERTQRYLESLESSNEQILVPTPALAEYLQGFEQGERKKQLQVIQRHFLTPPFDLAAAFLAADIAHRSRNPQGVQRQALKTDIQIIATAITAGAESIVTDEAKHFQSLAGERVRISQVPDIPVQEGFRFEL